MPLGLGGFTLDLGDGFVGLGRFTLGLLLGGLAGLPKARCPKVVGHARCLNQGRFGLLRDRSAGGVEFFSYVSTRKVKPLYLRDAAVK